MTDLRSTRTTICFGRPFTLPSLDEMLPAGTYEIDTEEEVIEGIERRLYVRVATLLHVRSTGKVRIVTIDPAELQAALDKDGAAQNRTSVQPSP